MKVTFPGLMFLVLLVLKLTKVIDWSWWWIASPFWGTLAIVFVVLMIKEIAKAMETPEQKAARSLRELANRLRSR